MPIIVGLTKMTYFAKMANLARIHQRSGKKFKWEQKRPISSWPFSRKWQESIKGFAKPQMRWQRGKSWQTAIIGKWQILGQKGKFCKNGEYTKKSSRLLPNIQKRWQKVASWQMAILQKLPIWQEFIGLAKIITRWQKRHVDNCGFYENDKFCEIGEFGFISGLAKVLNETTKERHSCFATTRQGGNVGDQYNIFFLE